jgi:hypothetical protein
MSKATEDDDDALKQKRSTMVMEGMHGDLAYMVYMA